MSADPSPIPPAPLDITYPDLPITARREELVAAIREHQVLVVAGETGSGKSTQLPKLCLEAGRGVRDEATGNGGWIGHTQPRRIAARSVAERVAEELGTDLGATVGYTVRFTDQVGPDARVKVMTDGILLAEIQRDRMLRRYDTIIVDEAHERSLNIDFLLGYLRQLLDKRPDLHVIITSATIDTARFSEHFADAPIIEVEGRTYPVELRYRPLGDTDQVDGIVDAVKELQRDLDGDVLVFCSGEREIRDAASALEDAKLRDTEIFPLFARLSAAEQHRVFESHKGRRVVLATNVAETSLTVPGIRAVVDPGTARISRYSHRTKVQRLPIEPVSQASANQRMGRCGRVGPGICIRLYDSDDFDSRPEFTEPEIRRTNLASVILQMAAIGLGDVSSFPFVDPPADRNVRDGIALLEELGAVDPDREPGTRKWLTPLGRRLVRIPIDPRLGRMVIEAGESGCLHEVMVIAAAMSIQDPRERPFEHRAAADQSHARFAHPASDFLTYVNLWDHVREQRRERTGNQFRRMCRQEYLNYLRLREWQDLYEQLRRSAKQLGYSPNRQPAEIDTVHQALLAGMLSHIGLRDTPDAKEQRAAANKRGPRARKPLVEYQGARQARFVIAPGSTFSKNPPEWIMAGELVETDRLRARTVAKIDPRWAERAGAHLVKRSYGEPWWDREKGAAMVHERVTLYGLPLAAQRRITLARVDPDEARDMFIHHALVEGDWDTHHEFVERNDETLAEADRIEARARRRDLLVEQQAIFDVYDRRIPDSITGAAAFDKWWKGERERNPHLLDLRLDDLLVDDAQDAIDHDAFPESWSIGGHDLPVTYEFDPTSPNDGATVTVPAGLVGQLDPTTFDWNVPGFRDDLVDALIRTLPKPLRKLFVPVPETVAEIAPLVGPDKGPVVETVRLALNRLITEPLPVDAFDLDRLPAHLRPTFRVVDERDQELARGKDLRALAVEVQDESRAAAATVVAEVAADLEQRGLRAWTFGDLPKVVERTVDGRRLRAYPALRDDEDSVSIVATASAADQAVTHWDGCRRLLRLAMPAPARQVDSLLDARTKSAMAQSTIQSKVDWYQDVIGCALDHLMADAGGPAWTEAEFVALVAAAKDGLHDTLREVAAHAASILHHHADLERTLDRLTAPRVATSVADAREHLDRLVYPGVLTGVGYGKLDDLDRYLRAIERRLAALPEKPDRDATMTQRLRQIESDYDDLVATVSPSDDIEAVAWQLEELRVSTFAQQVGTPSPVSEQRVRNEIHRLSRGL